MTIYDENKVPYLQIPIGAYFIAGPDYLMPFNIIVPILEWAPWL